MPRRTKPNRNAQPIRCFDKSSIDANVNANGLVVTVTTSTAIVSGFNSCVLFCRDLYRLCRRCRLDICLVDLFDSLVDTVLLVILRKGLVEVATPASFAVDFAAANGCSHTLATLDATGSYVVIDLTQLLDTFAAHSVATVLAALAHKKNTRVIHDAFEDAALQALGTGLHIVELLLAHAESGLERRYIASQASLLTDKVLLLRSQGHDALSQSQLLISEAQNRSLNVVFLGKLALYRSHGLLKMLVMVFMSLLNAPLLAVEE
ncbi:hypothetical protein HG530_004339 [Fusarium avenaceum]|nr:hypothetical protein HG530_004339 [Fusarium avenaceum]